MKTLRRITPIVVLAAVSVLAAFQLVGGPARYVIVSGNSMEPTLGSGDLALLVRHDSYRRGDVVAYHVPQGDPGAGAVVIHRVIGGSDRAGYVTEGDNRNGRDDWRPKPDDVIGKMVFQVPRGGLVPATLGGPMGLGLGAGLLAFFLLTGERKARPTRNPSQPGLQPGPAPTTSAPEPAPVIAPAVPGAVSARLVVTLSVALAAILLVAALARSRRPS
jgi:signal peptidase